MIAKARHSFTVPVTTQFSIFCPFVQVLTHRKVTMEVTPMTFITAEMKPATIGRFLISCEIHAHRHGKKGQITICFPNSTNFTSSIEMVALMVIVRHSPPRWYERFVHGGEMPRRSAGTRPA